MGDRFRYPDYIETEQIRPETAEVLDRKVKALLQAMTLDEKMSLCHGYEEGRGEVANGGYNPGVPRLGVPEIRMFDGPAGVTSLYETTGLPVQEMLAASWDPQLAYDYGKVEGSENYALSGNTQLGSEFDIVRTPQFDRAKDMLGEDSFLIRALAVPETKGIQDQHAAAVLKHFAVCAQDTLNQTAPDQLVDEQTLHELYFPGFEAAAKEGKAAAFMTAYNKFNGAYASANTYALQTVLRGMWGFKGYIMSDWGANHALTTHKGLDMEMASGAYNSNERLHLALEKGRLTEADIEKAAGHVLYSLGMMGYLTLVETDGNGCVREEAARREPIHLRDRYAEAASEGLLEENAAVCLEVARKGAVLLKNEREALPLSPADYTGGSSVAMLGLGAVRLLSGTAQERSYGTLSRMHAPVDELQRLAGKDAQIDCAVGLDIFGQTIPAEAFYTDASCTQHGVIRTYGVSKEDGNACGFMAMMSAMDDGKEGRKQTAPVGGAGVEFVGIALADNDEDSDVQEGPPPTNNAFDADMPGHETGSLCCIDKMIDFTVGTIAGSVNQTWKNAADGTAFTKGDAFTWDGYLTVPEDGTYDLIFQAIGGNADCKISLDGENMIPVGATEMREGAHWPWGNLVCTPEGMNLSGISADLKTGRTYHFRVLARACSAQKDLQVRLAWITPRQREADYREALQTAARADKVVLFLTGEYAYPRAGSPGGFDMSQIHLRSLEVPQVQKQFLYDVKKVMREDAKLIVAANSGNVFSMEWHEEADAILNVFSPGQEGGTAIAEILLGKVNPGGKMAVTIPEKDTDTPVSDTPEHVSRRYTGYRGADGSMYVDYDEGIFTGYRWYDQTGVKPLYAFGHGLSYTTFSYSDLKICGCDVTFTVTNTGLVPGTEIAQIYLGKAAVPEHIQMAQKQLCGFARLEDLQPGESRTVTITIPERSLCFWNPEAALMTRPDGTKDKWVRANGTRRLMVGGASDRLVLSAEVEF